MTSRDDAPVGPGGPVVPDDSELKEPGLYAAPPASFDELRLDVFPDTMTTMTTMKMLPMRYLAKEDQSGRYLTCVEASNIAVRVERGFAVSSSAARKYPEGTIFLDGAAQGEPFVDSVRKVYNLDHHEGCVRAFTLSTCEQAMVVILQGLDLRSRNWTVYANEPDLDAIFAIWILLNHARIRGGSSEARQRLMPLVRLQGVIDALGLELKELAGLPAELQRHCEEVIDALRAEELRLKQEGEWSSVDLLEYTTSVLHAIDTLVYTARDFEGMQQVEELAQVRVSGDRTAVVCRSEQGIYEVEQSLRKLHGDRLGLVILQKSPSTYTVRRVDPFLPTSLDQLFERLNLLDPNTSGTDRWGGGEEIGGSPRQRGTGLSAEEIVRICRWVFQQPTTRRPLRAVVTATAACLAVLAAAWMAAFKRLPAADFPGLMRAGATDTCGFFFVLVGAGAVALLLLFGVRRRPLQFGLRRPEGLGWLLTAPLGLVAGLSAASWAPLHLRFENLVGATTWLAYLVPLLGALAAELLFRGAVLGLLADHFWVQRPLGRWFLSIPNMTAALLYTCITVALVREPSWLQPLAGEPVQAVTWVGTTLVLGVTCGVVRERYRSVVPALVVHAVAAVGAWILAPMLFWS